MTTYIVFGEKKESPRFRGEPSYELKKKKNVSTSLPCFHSSAEGQLNFDLLNRS